MTPETITLTPQQLSDLVADAVRRAMARPVPPPEAWLGGPEAARYVYGRDDRLSAWHRLRQRHPELDTMSRGEGRTRRWLRSDLDRWIQERARPTNAVRLGEDAATTS